MSNELYSILTMYGTVYETTHRLENTIDFIKWTEENFNYIKYNPRKDIKRYGLSITSLDGSLSGIPDLDSLGEYNKENNTRFKEKDFRTFTSVYEYPDLQKMLKPIENNIFRSHILKLDPGGYFPPHRDFRGLKFDSFRLIVPLGNMNPPNFNFVIEDKIYHWNEGSVYFVDTAKMHYLFNASTNPSYLIVYNVDLTDDTVRFVIKNLVHR